MSARCQGSLTVSQCGSCGGVFLERSDLGALVEAENDWHRHRSTDTTRLPRITSDMTEPPRPDPRARSYVESLFKA